MYACAAFALLSLGFLFWYAMPAIEAGQIAATKTGLAVEALPGNVTAAIDSSIGKLIDQVDGLRADIRAVADKLDAPLTETTAVIKELKGIPGQLGGSILAAQHSLENIERATKAAEPIVEDVHRISASAAYVMDCSPAGAKGACLPATTLALIGSLRATSGQIARATPFILDNFKSIESSAKGTSESINASAQTFNIGFPTFIQHTTGVAANIDRLTKPHFYDRALGYGLAGASLYRALNPATNLTIKGGQFIATRP